MISVGTSESGAVFSDCMKYRYRLWRCWNPELPPIVFIMLNPSTADEISNDPTIERQWRRVQRWHRQDLLHFGAIEIVNAFAWRSTDPRGLYAQGVDPVGADNDGAIRLAVDAAVDEFGMVVCGWGSHARRIGRRHYELLDLLEGVDLHALKLNSDGTPQHPLYLGYELAPRLWADGELS